MTNADEPVADAQPPAAQPPAAPTKTAAAPPPASTKTADAPPPAAAPSQEASNTVDRVKFHVPGASKVEARCGDVQRSSTSASVNLSRVPAGGCSVTATVEGIEHSARVQVNSPNGFTCLPGDGGLACTSQL